MQTMSILQKPLKSPKRNVLRNTLSLSSAFELQRSWRIVQLNQLLEESEFGQPKKTDKENLERHTHTHTCILWFVQTAFLSIAQVYHCGLNVLPKTQSKGTTKIPFTPIHLNEEEQQRSFRLCPIFRHFSHSPCSSSLSTLFIFSCILHMSVCV